MQTSKAGLGIALALFFAGASARADVTEWSVAEDGGALAGYRDGFFFLRDRSDYYRFYVRGRAQLDSYLYLGRGVADSSLDDAFVFRRLQPEVSGEIGTWWTWTLGFAWQSARLQQPFGASMFQTGADPRSSPRGLRPIPADDYLALNLHPLFHLQVGRFDAPFMMDNRTSDVATPFLERSSATRNLGVPENKDIGAMAWGEPDSHVAHYEIGAFLAGGDSADFGDGYDVMTRVVLRPIWFFPIASDATLGASLRLGWRSADREQDALPGITTQSDYELWSTARLGPRGVVRAYPSGERDAQALEFRVPILRVDLAGEFMTMRESTRESLDSSTITALRSGTWSGHAYYLQGGFWLYGKQDLLGGEGSEPLPRADLVKTDRRQELSAFEVLFKYDHLTSSYASGNRSGGADPTVDGEVHIHAYTFGMNYFWRKHLRLSADYTFNVFNGAGARDSSQRASGPAQTLAPGVDDGARAHGDVLHELSFRAAVGF